MTEPRRLKIIRFTPEAIINFLFTWHKKKNIVLPYFRDLPEDVEIQRVDYSWEQNAFIVTLKSEEFDYVGLFEIPEVMPAWYVNIPLPSYVQAELRKIIDEIENPIQKETDIKGE